MALTPQTAWLTWTATADEPWDRRRAAHLFRRAGFGASRPHLDEAVKAGPEQAARQLVAATASQPKFDAEMQTLAQSLLAGGNPEALGGWWLYRMLHTPAPLLEKATLFWHGHFATSAEKVTDAQTMFNQNQLLRRHALGSFGDLVQGIARDPAMLLYLDSATNKKTHPNENFAREVMELFCLGLGNYTEKDIQELARCYTGWEIQRGEFKFNQYQHDYGTKTVLGKTGAFDGDDAAKVILDQPAAPMFICKKLVRFFVTDEDLPAEMIEPLAKQFRASGLVVAPVLEAILTSRYFYSDDAIGRKVRSPVELVLGLLRSLEATSSTRRLADDLGGLGQRLFYPPNVKGWDGGLAWINSATLLARANLVKQILDDGNTRYRGGPLADYIDGKLGWTKPAEVVEGLSELLLPAPLSSEVAGQFAAMLTATKKDRNQTLRQVIHTLAATPEFQLS